MTILGDFLMKKMEYLVMFMIILLRLIDIEQFLVYYEHINIYKSYMDMVLFYYYNKYNKYKKMNNIYNSNTKFLKNIKRTLFGDVTRSNISVCVIILTSKHGGMFTYFLKFFSCSVYLFMFTFMFFR